MNILGPPVRSDKHLRRGVSGRVQSQGPSRGKSEARCPGAQPGHRVDYGAGGVPQVVVAITCGSAMPVFRHASSRSCPVLARKALPRSLPR